MKSQKLSACSSCPWLTERDGSYFKPEALEKTIVDHHQAERIHYCHSNSNHFCTGYLAFLDSQPDGLFGHSMARMAISLGLLKVDLIPKVAVFTSILDMLLDHQNCYKNHYDR